MIRVSGQGDFNVELDWDYLKKEARGKASSNYRAMLRDAASLIVPIEIVCPPLAIDELALVDPLIMALHSAGARGTDDSLIAAYGLHINPSLPDLEADTIHDYLRAFALLQWWLVQAHKIDLSRRLTPFIDLYPGKYLKSVLKSGQVGMDSLIDDYLKYNATRNRALDMLPLFSFIDEEKVRRSVDDERIKPRPTFHYRLPNCLIGTPGWSLANAWNLWCLVEELACRPADLDSLGGEFLEAWRPLLGIEQERWMETMGQWLKRAELV